MPSKLEEAPVAGLERGARERAPVEQRAVAVGERTRRRAPVARAPRPSAQSASEIDGCGKRRARSPSRGVHPPRPDEVDGARASAVPGHGAAGYGVRTIWARACRRQRPWVQLAVMTPSRNPRRPPRERLGVAPGQGRDPRERDRARCGRRAARRRRPRLRGHRAPAARERAARRPRRHLPRRARPGEDPHHPLAHRPARRVDADRRRQRDQRRPVPPGLARTRGDLVAERGDETPIEWVHRDRRFGEKLATPDTSIADLIGEVDPIKVAEGRYLSDELTIHYGLVPRTNRGIFAINELPDLAERIQVGLLNVLEERDVQIRGYKIRLPLDVMLVASANPEDYTNRGRIITPLKDRFGAQIRTHYPLDVETEMDDHRAGGAAARRRTASTSPVPGLHDRDRRRDQPAGPPLAARQPALGRVGAALDRELRDAGRERDAPRRCATASTRSCRGSATSTRSSRRPRARSRSRRSTTAARARCSSASSRRASLEVFRARVRPERLGRSVAAFDDGRVVHTGEDVPSAEYADAASTTRPGSARRSATSASASRPAGLASAIEFVLEGLHLSKRLNKDAVGARATYRAQRADREPGRRPVLHPLALVPAAVLTGAPVHLVGTRSRPSGCRPRDVSPAWRFFSASRNVCASCSMSFGACAAMSDDQLDLLRELDAGRSRRSCRTGPRPRRTPSTAGAGSEVASLCSLQPADTRERRSRRRGRAQGHGACPDCDPSRRAPTRVGVRRDGDTLGSWRVPVASSTPGGTAPRSGSTSTPTPLLAEMTDDLLYHGDLNAALRRMLQQGFQDRNGERLQGMREMLERLRQRRREELDKHDLGGVYDDIAEQLDEIVDQERAGHRAAHAGGAATPATSGARRSPRTSPQDRQMELDLMPPDLAGRCSELQQYDFMDDAGAPAVRGADGRAAPAAHAELLQPDGRGHAGRVARADGAHEGHARRAQPDARAARAGRGARLRGLHGEATATSSPATRRRSTSCSSRWPARWPRCSRCSTR